LQAAENARDVSTTAGDLPLEVAANFYLGCVNVTSGSGVRAEQLFETVADSLTGELRKERCGLPFAPAVISRSWLVWALAERGEFEQGAKHGTAALEIAEEIQHPFNLAHIYYDLGYFYEIKGEISQAVDALEKAMGLVNEWSLTYLSPFIMGFLGHAYALSGRVEDGVELLRKAEAAYEAMGLGLFRSLIGMQLGEALLLGNETNNALSVTNQALALARKRGETGHQAYCTRLLADIASHPEQGGSQAALEQYKKALKSAKKLGMRPLEAHCHLGIGNVHKTLGDRKEVEKHADIAATIARDLGMKFWQDQHTGSSPA
ncbi:MAG: hypothetical protein ACR2O4_15940, partial [Hyphomicrobiaceae bacterium]